MEQKDWILILTKEVGCKFHSCESSNILTYGYRESDMSLWIVFKSNKSNKVFQYEGITKEQFQDLHKSESKGKWVYANLVKPKVNYQAYELV